MLDYLNEIESEEFDVSEDGSARLTKTNKLIDDIKINIELLRIKIDI